MKPTRLRSHESPVLPLCLGIVLLGVGIYIYWKEGALVEPVFCIVLSILLGYSASRRPLWIEIGDKFVYRTLFPGVHRHRWGDVAAVDLECSSNEAEPHQLEVQLTSGKRLSFVASRHLDVCATLSEVLQVNQLEEGIRRQLESAIKRCRPSVERSIESP